MSEIVGDKGKIIPATTDFVTPDKQIKVKIAPVDRDAFFAQCSMNISDQIREGRVRLENLVHCVLAQSTTREGNRVLKIVLPQEAEQKGFVFDKKKLATIEKPKANQVNLDKFISLGV